MFEPIKNQIPQPVSAFDKKLFEIALEQENIGLIVYLALFGDDYYFSDLDELISYIWDWQVSLEDLINLPELAPYLLKHLENQRIQTKQQIREIVREGAGDYQANLTTLKRIIVQELKTTEHRVDEEGTDLAVTGYLSHTYPSINSKNGIYTNLRKFHRKDVQVIRPYRIPGQIMPKRIARVLDRIGSFASHKFIQYLTLAVELNHYPIYISPQSYESALWHNPDTNLMQKLDLDLLQQIDIQIIDGYKIRVNHKGQIKCLYINYFDEQDQDRFHAYYDTTDQQFTEMLYKPGLAHHDPGQYLHYNYIDRLFVDIAYCHDSLIDPKNPGKALKLINNSLVNPERHLFGDYTNIEHQFESESYRLIEYLKLIRPERFTQSDLPSVMSIIEILTEKRRITDEANKQERLKQQERPYQFTNHISYPGSHIRNTDEEEFRRLEKYKLYDLEHRGVPIANNFLAINLPGKDLTPEQCITYDHNAVPEGVLVGTIRNRAPISTFYHEGLNAHILPTLLPLNTAGIRDITILGKQGFPVAHELLSDTQGNIFAVFKESNVLNFSIEYWTEEFEQADYPLDNEEIKQVLARLKKIEAIETISLIRAHLKDFELLYLSQLRNFLQDGSIYSYTSGFEIHRADPEILKAMSYDGLMHLQCDGAQLVLEYCLGNSLSFDLEAKSGYLVDQDSMVISAALAHRLSKIKHLSGSFIFDSTPWKTLANLSRTDTKEIDPANTLVAKIKQLKTEFLRELKTNYRHIPEFKDNPVHIFLRLLNQLILDEISLKKANEEIEHIKNLVEKHTENIGDLHKVTLRYSFAVSVLPLIAKYVHQTNQILGRALSES